MARIVDCALVADYLKEARRMLLGAAGASTDSGLDLGRLIEHLDVLHNLLKTGNVGDAIAANNDFSVIPHARWLALRGGGRIAGFAAIGGSANTEKQRAARKANAALPRRPLNWRRTEAAEQLGKAESFLASGGQAADFELLREAAKPGGGTIPIRTQRAMAKLLNEGCFRRVAAHLGGNWRARSYYKPKPYRAEGSESVSPSGTGNADRGQPMSSGALFATNTNPTGA